MDIPEEVVKAGAKAWDKHMGGRYAPREVEELRDEVRVILEAAAPHMMARSFEEGYGWGYSDHVWSKGHEPRARNPYPQEVTE